MSKKAILLGATGLVGRSLLDKLLADNRYDEILVISRKALPIERPQLKQLIINFDELADYAQQINGSEVFCCLGSTIKKTPDLAQYYKIDYQYPIDVAKIAFSNGVRHYHLVSAMGADVNSTLFYSRTKGEVERDLKQIPFHSLHIYRPALLDGVRKEERKRENKLINLMRFINPILIGPLKKYRSIPIENVASAMHIKANANEHGIHIYLSDRIAEIAKKG